MKKLFDGKSTRLCVDQYGHTIYARTVKELREERGGGKVSKMYVDRNDGRTLHVGYAVGNQWFTVYQPCEVPA